mmetsp:Transcript_46548/g.118804  ORF Transcript_46548/g.118804 Transcript_46548/m.118804 type:complete len:467 (-) Transcript_46548:50-1450(-)
MAGGGDERAFVVSEFRDGALDQTYRWRPGGEAQPVEVPEPGGGSGAAGKAAVWRLAAAFLPEGFPDSVTPDYLAFQTWDTAQALCSYVRGMLCQKAIMTGIGVGQEAATPMGALFHFFVRDLVGMMGGILFASSQGPLLDAHAKQWRLFADCINNAGLALELASPLFPAHFLLLACLGSIARALCGVAAGATRAAMTQHFARGRNAADVSAKEGSQETATTLVGMVVGMATTHLAADSQLLAWSAFGLLTMLHVYFNVRAVRALQLSSLNQPRLDCLLACSAPSPAPGPGNGDRALRLPSPAEVADREDMLPPPFRRLLRIVLRQPVTTVALGARLREVWDSAGGHSSAEDLADAERGGWMHLLALRRGRVHAVLHRKAGSEDVLRAYLHAAAVMRALNARPGKATRGAALSAMRGSRAWLDSQGDGFTAALAAAGWDLSRVLLLTGAWRAEWAVEGSAGGGKATR